MFKRKLEIKLVKDDKREKPETPDMILERINSKENLKELGKFVIVGTIVVIGATIAMTTVKELIVNALDTTE